MGEAILHNCCRPYNYSFYNNVPVGWYLQVSQAAMDYSILQSCCVSALTRRLRDFEVHNIKSMSCYRWESVVQSNQKTVFDVSEWQRMPYHYGFRAGKNIDLFRSAHLCC